MRKIDAHHHLWEFNTTDYGWMDDSMKILKKNYFPVDLVSELQENGLEGTVVVQARQKYDETSWLLKLAEENEFIKAVVGWVDLRSPDLEREMEPFVNHPYLKGVRHVIHDEPDLDFMLGSSFMKGLKYIEKYGLTYDLLLFPQHLPNAIKLVNKFPSLQFVVDHIAKPRIAEGLLEPWAADIMKLASFSNVCCKISGMVTEADHASWKYEDMVPYLDVVTEAFSTKRLMIGSDWPVCLLAGSYSEVLSISEKYFDSFSEDEKDEVFYRNAKDFYRIGT